MELLKERLKRYKVFLGVSLVLGMLDNITTTIANTYGLGKYEFSSLHKFLGAESILSWVVAFIGPALIILFVGMQIKGKRALLIHPHVIVALQLLNVTLTGILIRLASLGRLVI